MAYVPGMPSPNHVAHFAINATDLEAAKKFYAAVFGWRFEAWGPPDFYMIKTAGGEDPGLFGSLQKRHERHESSAGRGTTGFDCTVAVASVDDAAKKVVKAGGAITMKRMTINGVGHLVRFRDPDGNVLGAMEYDENAR